MLSKRSEGATVLDMWENYTAPYYAAANSNVAVLDLARKFPDCQDTSLWPDRLHPNDVMHARIGHAVARFLIDGA